jgi:hypothetical protein
MDVFTASLKKGEITSGLSQILMALTTTKGGSHGSDPPSVNYGLDEQEQQREQTHRYLTNAPNARIGNATSKKSRNMTRRAISSRGKAIAQIPTTTATRTIKATNNLNIMHNLLCINVRTIILSRQTKG